MHMKSVPFLSVFALLLASAVFATTIPSSLAGIDKYDPLQHSHLIVLGRVNSVTVERVSREAWGIANAAGFQRITRVRTAVLDVLRGDWHDAEIVISLEGVAFPFKPGEELVICCKWRPLPTGGTYVTGSNIGVYLGVDGEWTKWVNDPSLQRAESLTTGQLTARVSDGLMKSVADSADVVARGIVVGTWESTYIGSENKIGTLRHYRLQVSEWIKGGRSGDELVFVSAAVNSQYVPKWYRTIPAGIEDGQEWLVLLRNGPEGPYPFGGPNSLLRIDRGRLIFDRVVILPDTAEEAIGSLRAGARRERN